MEDNTSGILKNSIALIKAKIEDVFYIKGELEKLEPKKLLEELLEDLGKLNDDVDEWEDEWRNEVDYWEDQAKEYEDQVDRAEEAKDDLKLKIGGLTVELEELKNKIGKKKNQL
jgi:chromosome segregation ATPase